MASKIAVNLDTSKEKYESYKCKQNDDLTLEANIFENGAAKNLTNCSIIIQARKNDNTYVIQNTKITKGNNKITAELDKDFTRVPGETLIEIVLTESSKQNTTFSFDLIVQPSVLKGAVESSNTVTILEDLQEKIVEAGLVRDETEQLIISGGAATKVDIQKVNTQLADNMQQVDKIIEDMLIEKSRVDGFGINVKGLGYLAYGDGVHDDTLAIQKAFDDAGHGGCIFFPFSWSKYKITSPIIVRYNDIKVYSSVKAEYSTAISSFDPTMECVFDVRGYGFSIRNIQIEQNGYSLGKAPTVSGIKFTMEHAGTPSLNNPNNANIDAEIAYCGFMNLKDCIIGTGRNIFIHDNIFSVSIRGIVINIFAGQECRGNRIYNNRFHAIGHNGNVGSAFLGSCCIQLPNDDNELCFGNQIEMNFVDFSTTFLDGNIDGSKIKDNFCYDMYGDFLSSGQSSTIVKKSTRHTQVEGNVFEGRLIIVDDKNKNDIPTTKESQYGVNIKNINNISHKNNIYKNVSKNGIRFNCCSYGVNEGNTIINPDLVWYRRGTRSFDAISLVDSPNLITKNNYIMSTKTSGGVTNIRNGIEIINSVAGTYYYDVYENFVLDFIGSEIYPDVSTVLNPKKTGNIKLYLDTKKVASQIINFSRLNTENVEKTMFEIDVSNASLTSGTEKAISKIKNMCNGVLTDMITLNWDKTISIPMTWNGVHFVFGTYHVWLSSSGKLMIKLGAPASDTDGVVLGTQT